MMLEQLDRDALVRELEAAGAKVKGLAVNCPFHEDKTPSGQLYQEGNHWRFKCHAASCGFCGDIYDVRAKLTGQPLNNVLKEVQPEKPPIKTYRTVEEIESSLNGTLEQRFTYTNPESREPDLIVLRYKRNGKKSFYQISPTENGFVMKAPPKPWPLYNRIELQKADTVVVVEGELCVHTLRKAGLAGTTSPCGAGKAQYADWTPLAGKNVYLWPDNDVGGIEHLKDVAQILNKLNPAPTVFWINPTDYNLPEHGDVVDFLKTFDSKLHRTAVLQVLANAKSFNPLAELDTWFEDVIAGKIESVGWPWPVLGELTQALMPESLVLLCGAPGSSKSLLLLQCLAYWHEKGIKVAAFELEVNKRFHLARALAQRAENSNLCDMNWIKSNHDEVRQAKAKPENKEFLRQFEKCIYAAPNKEINLNYLVQWVQERAEEGCRIVVIDPVTMASIEREPWIADAKFILSLRAIAGKYKISIILVTHPKKTIGGQKTNVELDALAGGAAYQRFTDTILWLQSFPDSKEFMVLMPVGRTNCEVNRVIRILKANNGKGAGVGIAFKFNSENLKLAEQGIIIPEHKKKD